MDPRPIRVLPRDVAERIAAGEVIERPASVVRELLDNALDAGATEITVELRGGGLELIRVGDDGRGIPPDQLELAFQRHATSKIAAVEDLARLATLGFRGEALPSIAAVAEVTMLTRVAEKDVGASIVLRGGHVLRSGRAARQRGTSVTVRHLFHNVPARLKFLPAGRAESVMVGHLVRRYALAYPERRFTFLLDGRSSFRSRGRGTLRDALADVYGAVVAASLLPLAPVAVEGATIYGFISGRTVTRPGRQHLTLVVNRRWAGSRALYQALEAAYRPLLPRGRHPIAAIVLEVPPAELDPNVHPAKTEIRLVREVAVASALADAVKVTLGQAPARPGIDEDFALADRQIALPLAARRLSEGRGPGWRATSDDDEPLRYVLPSLRILGQSGGTLILGEGPRGLYLVDQHRAHERIIFERMLRGVAAGDPSAQTLLEPVVLELKPHQATLLEERLAYLEGLGFSCQRFGGRDFLVRAVPALPGGDALAIHAAALIDEAAAEGEDWRDRLMASLSCRAAIRRGRPLAEAEMGRLLEDLAATDAPAVCPHGSPLVLHLSATFLERQFGW